MTLQEVAQELARRLDARVEPVVAPKSESEEAQPAEVCIQGKGYQVVVSPFFGGWQATLHLPKEAPLAFFAENVDMLESRLKAKLTGRDYRF